MTDGAGAKPFPNNVWYNFLLDALLHHPHQCSKQKFYLYRTPG